MVTRIGIALVNVLAAEQPGALVAHRAGATFETRDQVDALAVHVARLRAITFATLGIRHIRALVNVFAAAQREPAVS